MLTSIYIWRISSYILCLSKKFEDRELIDSAAFLMASANGDDLEFFAPSGDHVGYYGKLEEDAKGECEQYVRIFSSYNEKTIKATAIKLWHYYAGKNIAFKNEEKKLLSELGIRV
jgi:hypothetical protein